MSFESAFPVKNDMIEGIKLLIERMARPSTSNQQRIEKAVRFGFAGNFARQGAGDSPPWAPLAPRTQRERARAGYNPTTPILIRSGGFRNSWVTNSPTGFMAMAYSPNGWTMTVGSGDFRAPILGLGAPGRNLPARAVHYLDNGQINNIAGAMEEMQTRVIESLNY